MLTYGGGSIIGFAATFSDFISNSTRFSQRESVASSERLMVMFLLLAELSTLGYATLCHFILTNTDTPIQDEQLEPSTADLRKRLSRNSCICILGAKAPTVLILASFVIALREFDIVVNFWYDMTPSFVHLNCNYECNTKCAREASFTQKGLYGAGGQCVRLLSLLL